MALCKSRLRIAEYKKNIITVQNKFKFCVLDSHNPINQGRCLKIKNQGTIFVSYVFKYL